MDNLVIDPVYSENPELWATFIAGTLYLFFNLWLVMGKRAEIEPDLALLQIKQAKKYTYRKKGEIKLIQLEKQAKLYKILMYSIYTLVLLMHYFAFWEIAPVHLWWWLAPISLYLLVFLFGEMWIRFWKIRAVASEKGEKVDGLGPF